MSQTGNTVTSVSDFKRIKRDIDPASARAAKSKADSISEDLAYLVAKRKLPKSE